MVSNAVLLKGAMQALGLTGVALAELISSMRDDGKVTAPETVSRWLTGTSPVEPAVMGWLRELLRVKALESARTVVTFPAKGSIMIAVSNLKGGVGTTTVAAALAIVAAHDHHLKTKHIMVGRTHKDIQLAMTLLRIDSVHMSLESALAYEPANEEIVVMDVSSEAAYEVLDGQTNGFLAKFEPDIMVAPADFGSALDVLSTRKFVDLAAHRALIRLLHRPRYMSNDYSVIAADSGFDVASEQFVPFFIPQSSSSEVLKSGSFQAWGDEEQHLHYRELFEYLLRELGVEIDERGDRELEIRRMDLTDLLTFVAPLGKPLRGRAR